MYVCMYVLLALASSKGLEEDTLREALLTLETKVSISDFPPASSLMCLCQLAAMYTYTHTHEYIHIHIYT